MEKTTTKSEQKKLNNLARAIIANNQYTSLATADTKGNPWVSTLAYAYDKDWNLYFVSVPDSKHCKNMALDKNIAFSIFDSHQAWGDGVGLQIEGHTEEIPAKDILKVSRIYAQREYPFGTITPKIVFDFLDFALRKKKLYKFYKLVPETIWINDPYAKIDTRVKVDLTL